MNNLKVLRETKKVSQAELARYVGVVRSAMCQYENGSRQIPDEIKFKLADYFNVSVDYLLGRIENEEDKKIKRIHEVVPLSKSIAITVFLQICIKLITLKL